jgi:hypothetical protein
MNWSYKEQRLLMEIAASAESLEELSERLGKSPKAIRNMALKLGISLKFNSAPGLSVPALKAKSK